MHVNTNILNNKCSSHSQEQKQWLTLDREFKGGCLSLRLSSGILIKQPRNDDKVCMAITQFNEGRERTLDLKAFDNCEDLKAVQMHWTVENDGRFVMWSQKCEMSSHLSACMKTYSTDTTSNPRDYGFNPKISKNMTAHDSLFCTFC